MSKPRSPLSLLAPVLCAGLLVALLFVGGISARRPLGTDDYRARVRAALEAIPFKIGPAVGTEVEPIPAAVKLLSPNKILERRYVDPTNGEYFSLLIIHCGDVRDMIGHYPPVCYPAHGWKLLGSQPREIEISGEHAVAVRYDFTYQEDLFERRMSVLNFFVIPEGHASLFSEMDAVEKASRSSDVGGLGVAQVQIVMSQDSDPQWREMVVRETLQSIAPAIRTIAQGVQK
jgi:hypothetical protein